MKVLHGPSRFSAFLSIDQDWARLRLVRRFLALAGCSSSSLACALLAAAAAAGLGFGSSSAGSEGVFCPKEFPPRAPLTCSCDALNSRTPAQPRNALTNYHISVMHCHSHDWQALQ